MMITMNRKLVYALPVLVAIVALVAVAAAPHVMADQGKAWHKGKFQRHFIEADGFTGSIPITKDTDKSTLKDQVKISLSQASEGLDVQGGHLGVVTNENGEKFLAWILCSFDKSGDTPTMTIHVVDPVTGKDTLVTKSFDHSFKMHDESDKA